MSKFKIFLEVGFEHILDPRLFTDIMSAEGYDHLLYIVALAVVYRLRDWRQVLWLVTAFTIGHSVTLALATFNIVSLSSSVVEFLIPVTILLTALYNLAFAKKILASKQHTLRYWSAFGFGLIHGLGFSTLLRSMLMGSESIVVPLLGFNLGLEVGQLLIVLATLILFFIVHRVLKVPHLRWVQVVSLIVAAMSLMILLGD